MLDKIEKVISSLHTMYWHHLLSLYIKYNNSTNGFSLLNHYLRYTAVYGCTGPYKAAVYGFTGLIICCSQLY